MVCFSLHHLWGPIDKSLSPPVDPLNHLILNGLEVCAAKRNEILMSPHVRAQALRNFALEIEVPSRYHSQIIGRRGATVTELRKKHDVNIQFPARDDPDANMVS